MRHHEVLKAFEALNGTMQDVQNSVRLMGGATVVLAGDFYQTLPVIQREHVLMK
jgi:hypothetical protein